MAAGCRPLTLCLALGALPAVDVWGSMIVNRAPNASVIAEIFVETGKVWVEWEARPDLPVRIALGAVELPGATVTPRGSRRSAEFDLPGKPSTLSIAPPPDAAAEEIGFVLYHLGLPVSDLHYLSRPQVVELDWNDPWRSRFRDRRLRRQFDTPAGVFLYVEPFQVRVEIIARLIDLQPSIDLGLSGRKTIPAASRADLQAKVSRFLGGQLALEVDGSPAEPHPDRVQFLRQRLLTSEVVPPEQDLPAVAATVGVTLSLARDGYPRDARLAWKLFNERIPRVAGSVTDENVSRPELLRPESNVLRWENLRGTVGVPELARLQGPPAVPWWLWLAAGSACAGAVLFAGLRAARDLRVGRPLSRRAIALGFVLLLGAAWAFGRASSARVRPSEARAIVRALLWNVYHAFDYREEEAVYDALARSVSGELLVQTYLEARRALELENQGGARARVKALDLVDLEIANATASRGFRARCGWDVAASVGHWGHIHQRRNRYEGELTVEPVDGVWKIAELHVFSEERK